MAAPRRSGMSRNLSKAMRERSASERWIDSMQLEIGSRMAEIAAMFLPGVHVTVLVRRPGHNDADICVTDDLFPDILAMVERCRARDASN